MTTAELLDVSRLAAVEVEHQPGDVERRITTIEQRLAALMATGGATRSRDNDERVFTYSWPALDGAHRWTARRVMHLVGSENDGWRRHTRVRLERMGDDGVTVDAEYGLNGDRVSRLRPAKNITLTDGHQQVLLGELRASLDTHIIDLGIESYLADVVDDEIIDATPEEWTAIIAADERLVLEYGAMANRHAGQPEIDSVRVPVDATVLRRIRLLTSHMGRADDSDVHEDVVPFVETHLGADAEGREFATVYIGFNNVEDAAGKTPDVIEITQDGHEHYYVVSEGAIFAHGAHGEDEDMIDGRLQLDEHIRALNEQLRHLAYEASKEDLPLQQRIPLFVAGIGDGNTTFIEEFQMSDTRYRLTVAPSLRTYGVFLYNLDDETDWYIMQVQRGNNRPIATLTKDGQTLGNSHAEELVATGMDLIQELWAEPKNEYEAAIRVTSDFLDDNGVEFASLATDHGTSPVGRHAIIEGQAGFDEWNRPVGETMTFRVEQTALLGPDGRPNSPSTRVIVSVMDDDDRTKLARRATYYLHADGFTLVESTDRRTRRASRTAESDFESFARNVLHISQ